MDQWDPMKEAFENKHFNSYNEGVGRDLSGGSRHNKGVKLYVKSIPHSLGKTGLYNLFAEYGKVLDHALLNSDSSDSRGACGLVTMENVLDAEAAIRKLNKKRLGQFTLHVSPALSQDERNRRKKLKQDERNFHRDTIAGRPGLLDKETVMAESAVHAKSTLGLEMDSGDAQPQFSSFGRGRAIPVTEKGDASHHPRGSLLSNMEMDREAPRSFQATRMKLCVYCYKEECFHVCSRCKMYYCSTDCQKKDWPRHKDICITIGEMCDSDTDVSVSSNSDMNHSFRNKYVNTDMETMTSHMKEYPHKKMNDRSGNVGYCASDTNVNEERGKENHKEQKYFRGRHEISDDKVNTSHFASKLQNTSSDYLTSNLNTHITDSQRYHNMRTPMTTNSDQAGRYHNKLQNNKCPPMESDMGNRKTPRHSGEATLSAGTAANALKFNKFQNNINELDDSSMVTKNSISQKSPIEKAVHMSSKQEGHFKMSNNNITKANGDERRISNQYQGKATNETMMRNSTYEKNGQELDRSQEKNRMDVRGTSEFKGLKTEKSGEIDTNSEMLVDKDTSIMELSISIKMSGLCYLTYFESPYKFWISLQEFLEDFTKNTMLMEKELTKAHPSLPTDCKVGSTYGVICMGEWCRATILSVRGTEATVFYPDYGNQGIVNLEDLRPLTKEMLEPPAQAVCCCVSKLKPKASESWNEAACAAMKEWLGEPMTTFLQYEIVSKKGPVHAVNIMRDNTSLSEFLQSKGFATPVNSQPGLSTPTNMSRDGNHEAARLMACSLASKMDELEIGVNFSAVFVDLIPPHKFTVLDITSDNLLNNLAALLQEEYANNTAAYRPVQGELVAAKYSSDQKWYRAEVTSIDGDSCTVFFVDYGNSDVQAVKNIRVLTKQKLIDFPKQALICSMFASKSFSEIGVDIVEKEFQALLLSSLHGEGQCLLQVKEKTKDALLVDFVEKSGLSEALTRRLLQLCSSSFHQNIPRLACDGQRAPKSNCLTSPPASPENVSHSQHVFPVKSDSAIHNSASGLSISTEILPDTGEMIPAMVTHIDSGSRLFLSRKDMQADLIQVMVKLNESTYKYPQLSKAVPGSVCSAQYSLDDTWYRARVTEIRSLTSCIIQFVDYGNSEETQISKLRELDPALVKLPSQAICCCLSGCESELTKAFAQRSLSLDAVELIHKLRTELLEKIVNIRVVDKKLNTWVIKMENESGECISSKYLSPTPKMAPTPMLSDLTYETPSEKEFDAFFSYIKNLSDFFCQRCDTRVLEELQSLSDNLRDDVSKIDGDFHIDPIVDGIYCNKFEGSWYRCVVEEVKSSTVLIRYIDYGNSEKVPTNLLRPLNPDRLVVPVRLLKCKLHGVTPVQENWNSLEMKEYLEILQQNKVCIVVEAKEKDTFLVSLNVLGDSEKVSVAADLVDIGMAKYLQVVSPQKDIKGKLPYPVGHFHQTHNVDNEDEDENELEITRKIQELQMQLKLSQEKKKQKH